jgi:hypothetical protein
MPVLEDANYFDDIGMQNQFEVEARPVTPSAAVSETMSSASTSARAMPPSSSSSAASSMLSSSSVKSGKSLGLAFSPCRVPVVGVTWGQWLVWLRGCHVPLVLHLMSKTS